MKKRYGFVLAVVVFVLMFFMLKDINFVEVLELLSKIDMFWFWLAFCSIAIMFVLWTIRFRNTLRNLVGGGMNYFYLFAVLLSGVFINTITPGSSVGGEPVRAYFLNKKFKKSKTKFLGIIFADKVFNVLTFGCFLVFSILFVLIFVNIPLIFKIIFECILVGILLMVILIFFGGKINFRLRSVLRRVYWFGFVNKKFRNFGEFDRYIRKRIRNFASGFKKSFFNGRTLAVGLSLSCVMWILNFLSSYFLFFSFGSEISFFFGCYCYYFELCDWGFVAGSWRCWFG